MPHRPPIHRPYTPGKRHERPRASPSMRGYGRTWQKVRNAYLRAHPLCEDCLAENIVEPAREVDHKVPLADGGAPYDWRNLRALCTPHHSKKTAKDTWAKQKGTAIDESKG